MDRESKDYKEEYEDYHNYVEAIENRLKMAIVKFEIDEKDDQEKCLYRHI